MISLVDSHKTTILITTHYIEEAKRANIIGFLRKGQLLVENSPQFLMKKYETNSLERLFFKLCVEQTESRKAQDKLSHHIDVNFNNSMNEMIEKSFVDQQQSPTTSCESSAESSVDDLNELKNGGSSSSLAASSIGNRNEVLFKIPWVDPNNRNPVTRWFIQYFAIISKYFILTSRRPETVLAQYVLPLIAIATFCVCIGSTPTGIKLAVINEEDCGYPFDLNEHLKQRPINDVDEFIEKLESFFTGRKGGGGAVMANDDRRAKPAKRSIELTTLNLDILNEEEEATTSYPTKFNLMNNLNFNEKRDSKESEPTSLNDLSVENNSLNRLLAAHNPVMTTQTSVTSGNSSASNTSSTTTGPSVEEHLVPTSDSSIVLVDNKEDDPPAPKPVLSDENSPEEISSNDYSPKENYRDWNSAGDGNFSDWGSAVDGNFSDWGSAGAGNYSDWGSASDGNNSDSTSDENEEEPDPTSSDDEMRSHLVNSQFADACFSQLLIRKMNDFIFTKIPYTSHAKAIEDVRSGKIWGVIRIKKGFSRALISKVLFMDQGDVNITDALVDINADLTNRALIITLEVTLSRLYPEFIQEILTRANEINLQLNSNSSDNETNYKYYNINSGRLPIILGEHVFKPKFTLSDYFGIREFAGKSQWTELEFNKLQFLKESKVLIQN